MGHDIVIAVSSAYAWMLTLGGIGIFNSPLMTTFHNSGLIGDPCGLPKVGVSYTCDTLVL